MKFPRYSFVFIFMLQSLFIFSQNNADNGIKTKGPSSQIQGTYPRTAPVYYKDVKENDASLKEGDKGTRRVTGNSNTDGQQNTLPRTAPVMANASINAQNNTNKEKTGEAATRTNKISADSIGRTAPVLYNDPEGNNKKTK